MAFTFRLFLGPMFAGKTSKLLKTIHYYKQHRNLKTIILLRSNVDNRSQFNLLSNHDQHQQKSLVAADLATLKQHFGVLNQPVQTVFMSEVQFFTPEIAKMLTFLQTQSVTEVIGEGLISDFRNQPFPIMSTFQQFKPEIKHLYARCEICFNKANTSWRLSHHQALFLPGGKGLYVALCAQCYAQKNAAQS